MAIAMCFPGLAEWWLHKGLEAEVLGWLARLIIVIHAQIAMSFSVDW